MYHIDEFIVCGGNGVCQVKTIGVLNINGLDKDKEYYTLEPVYSKGSKVYTAVDNQKTLRRKVLSKEEADALIEEIPQIETIWVANEKQRENLYKEALQKYDCREYVKVIKTLYLRKEERLAEGKKITSTDERYLRAAEESLYGELAIPLGLTKGKTQLFIAERIKL